MPRHRPRPAALTRALPRTAADSLPFHALRLVLLLATVAAIALLSAGCEGTDDRDPEEVGRPPGAAAVDDPGPAPAGDAGVGEATTTSEVEVRLHDRLIEMPSSLPAAETTFTVANTGAVAHGFEIEGPGIERAIERIEPGATGTLTVTLRPGTYTVYCPVENHRAEGMEVTLRVIP